MDAVNPEERPVTLARVLLSSCALIFFTLDEEASLALAGAVWLYKCTCRATRSVMSMSPATILSGAIASGAATAARPLYSDGAYRSVVSRVTGAPPPPLLLRAGGDSLLSGLLDARAPALNRAFSRVFNAWPAGADLAHAKDAQAVWVRQGAVGAVFNAPSVRVAPALWGLRLGIHDAVLHRFMRPDPSGIEPGVAQRFALACAAGAWSEFWARVLCAPAVRLSHIAASENLPMPRAAAAMWKDGGLAGLWRGCAPLRTEVPVMAAQLGVFSTSRDAATTALGLEWDPSATWLQRALPRIPVDAGCGALSAAVACSVTQHLRSHVEVGRSEALHVMELGGEAAQVVPRPSVFLPLSEVLAARVPQAAILFAAFGALQAAVRPDHREAGFSGWGDTPLKVSKYGELVMTRDGVMNDFWDFFGVSVGADQSYRHAAKGKS